MLPSQSLFHKVTSIKVLPLLHWPHCQDNLKFTPFSINCILNVSNPALSGLLSDFLYVYFCLYMAFSFLFTFICLFFLIWQDLFGCTLLCNILSLSDHIFPLGVPQNSKKILKVVHCFF